MSWGGFGNYSGSNASAYANRSGPFPSTYSRGGAGSLGGGRGYGYGYGSSGGAGGGSGGFGMNTSYTPSSALHSGGSSGATATPRVAILGTAHAAFTNWWAMHAAGLEVRVVVGVEDAMSGAGGSDDVQRASAETARAFAARCAQLYRLPQASTSSSSSSIPSTGVTPAALAKAMDVRVRVSDSEAPANTVPSASPTTSTIAPSGGGAASLAAATALSGKAEGMKEASNERHITATSWGYFFKPLLAAQKEGPEGQTGGSPPPSLSAGGSSSSSSSYWSMRGAAAGNALHTSSPPTSTSAPPPLVEEVDVVFVSESIRHNSSSSSSTDASDDDAGLRVALLWLIRKGKHVVVDCALTCTTLAACASAASTVTRGKAEMQRVFLYRGGGIRCGWSPAAMTQLRTALAVRRGSGQALKSAKNAATAAAAPAAPAAVASTAAPTSTTPAAAPATSKAPEADDAFSVFDFMGGDVNPFGEAASETDKVVAATTTATTTAAANSNKGAEAAMSAPAGATDGLAEDKKAMASVVPPVITSIAVDEEAGVTGALHQVRFTVRAGDPDAGAYAPLLGVMDRVGWDVVAWVLHLMDWTCPDMVQGRVVRRASHTQAPLCVEAMLYYGLDGTAEEGCADSSEGKGQEAPRPARPRYLRVLLNMGVSAEGCVYQQCVRAVGTKAVVTVPYPLLPPVSASSVKGGAGGSQLASSSSSPPPAASTTAASSPFKVTTTRFVGAGAAAAGVVGSSSTAISDTAASAAAASASLPATPSVDYTYVLATQDAPPGSSGRLRKEVAVSVSSADGEPCAEARLWQHVREQLRVTTSTPASASPYSGAAGGGGGYQPYGARGLTRGRYGAHVGLGSAYARGRGSAMQGYGAYGASAFSLTPTAGAASTQPVVKAELATPEAAALDVQRAWLVQTVVDRILASAVG